MLWHYVNHARSLFIIYQIYRSYYVVNLVDYFYGLNLLR